MELERTRHPSVPEAWLGSLERAGRLLGEVTDLDVLLPRLLTEARGICSAEGGSILLREGDTLVFTYAQNDRLNVVQRFPDPRLSPVKLPLDRTSIAGAAALDGVVVVDDAYTLPPGSTFSFNRSFDDASGYRTRAVAAIAMKDSRGGLLGVLQLINPRASATHEGVVFSQTDSRLLQHFASLASVALERARITRAVILRMIRLTELRDPTETAIHVSRVADIAARLYEDWAADQGISMKEREQQLDLLRPAAMLHDVGKIGIPDAILAKRGALTPAERLVVERHTIVGAQTVLGFTTALDVPVRDVALYHHCRWDGAGYPSHADIRATLGEFGVEPGSVPEPRGEGTPLFARIVSIADVFDALLSARAYKEAWEPQRARAEIESLRGKAFDPALVGLFLDGFEGHVAAHRAYG